MQNFLSQFCLHFRLTSTVLFASLSHARAWEWLRETPVRREFYMYASCMHKRRHLQFVASPYNSLPLLNLLLKLPFRTLVYVFSESLYHYTPFVKLFPYCFCLLCYRLKIVAFLIRPQNLSTFDKNWKTTERQTKSPNAVLPV